MRWRLNMVPPNCSGNRRNTRCSERKRCRFRCNRHIWTPRIELVGQNVHQSKVHPRLLTKGLRTTEVTRSAHTGSQLCPPSTGTWRRHLRHNYPIYADPYLWTSLWSVPSPYVRSFTVNRRKLSWFGHVCRHAEDRTTRNS